MRVYIDAWDPSYGSGMEISDGGPTGETKADVRLDIEIPTDNWRPLSPPPDLRAPSSVLFLDGVRRGTSNTLTSGWESLESHLMAFAAEEARTTGSIVRMDEYRAICEMIRR